MRCKHATLAQTALREGSQGCLDRMPAVAPGERPAAERPLAASGAGPDGLGRRGAGALAPLALGDGALAALAAVPAEEVAAGEKAPDEHHRRRARVRLVADPGAGGEGEAPAVDPERGTGQEGVQAHRHVVEQDLASLFLDLLGGHLLEVLAAEAFDDLPLHVVRHTRMNNGEDDVHEAETHQLILLGVICAVTEYSHGPDCCRARDDHADPGAHDVVPKGVVDDGLPEFTNGRAAVLEDVAATLAEGARELAEPTDALGDVDHGLRLRAC
mmetsp:Transcript_5248/g.14099  ORF Transcript_5248/g.14099 Transcript_5248/m.14099 type:complete len:271 (-) Transcript_5248:73-885(-)